MKNKLGDLDNDESLQKCQNAFWKCEMMMHGLANCGDWLRLTWTWAGKPIGAH